MRKPETPGAQEASLDEVKAVVDDLLIRAAGSNVTESGLFPHGVTRVSVRVAVGAVEVSVDISGPDHSHPFPFDDTSWGEDEAELFGEEEAQ